MTFCCPVLVVPVIISGIYGCSGDFMLSVSISCKFENTVVHHAMANGCDMDDIRNMAVFGMYFIYIRLAVREINIHNMVDILNVF